MKEAENKEIRNDKAIQMVVFKLGHEEFGVDILQVKTIEKIERGITRVPRAPHFVEGVFNLRGEIVPLVDLRKRFGLMVPELTEDSRVVIVEIEGNLVGMLVDAVPQVMRILVDDIEATPPIAKGVDAYFLRGVARVGDRLIVLLNLERALTAEEMSELSQSEVG